MTLPLNIVCTDNAFRFVVGVLDHSGSKYLREKFATARFGLGTHPHGIVMKAADRNLAVIKLQERPTFKHIIHIMRQVALALQHLHSNSVVHGDIKPLNIVRCIEGGQERYMLIDLDAAVRIGVDRVGRKYSSAYAPPEGMAAIAGIKGFPLAHPSWDIHSYGVVLFELLTSTPLFPRNTLNDNIEEIETKRRLCVWHGPTPAMLDKIRKADVGSVRASQVEAACHLVEWCLQDADRRPTIAQILEHTLFTPANALAPRTALSDGRWFQTWHMFISHMQVQANGEAARLAQMIEHLGGTAWLDVKAVNLTVDGMMCGVRNSKAFVLLLTSDVLTRPFCLREISTAINAGCCPHWLIWLCVSPLLLHVSRCHDCIV